MKYSKAIEESKKKRGIYVWYARIPFLAAVAAGAAGMYLMKAYGFSQVQVTVFACAMILGYALLVAATPVLRIRDDQLADNCYYLGFLYTLMSLAYALYQYALTKSIEVIVSNFGVALASTIVGVVARVFINQARRDVLETERDARIELAEAVVRMRVEVDDAVLALSSFCRNARQAAEEQIRATAEESNKALEEGVKRVGEASTAVLERIEEAFREFRDHATTLNQTSGETVKAIRSLLNRIEKIDAPSDLVSRRLEPALQATEAIAARLRQKLQDDEALLGDFAIKSRDLMSTISEAMNRVSDVGGASTRAAADAKIATDRLASLATSVEAVVAQQSDLAESLRRHNTGMEQELERTRKVSSEMAGALTGLADSITERLR
ncbi:MAG: hypothetical protein HYU58_09050 [Proteobacteria bacterium]|nr:hypothetical protein [Pseudomonadota bacterium]